MYAVYDDFKADKNLIADKKYKIVAARSCSQKHVYRYFITVIKLQNYKK